MRLAALLLAALPCLVLAEPITLKGLAPGMTKAQIEAAHPGITLRCFKPAANAMTHELCGSHGDNYGPLATFAGVKAKSYVAHLRDDVVHTVTVSISPADFDAAVAAVSERYGKPTRAESTVSNRMGAKFDQVRVHWVVEDSALAGSKRAGDLETSSFHLTTKAAAMESEKRRQDAAKKGAQDM